MAVHQSLQCWLTDSVLCVCGLPDGAGGAEPCPCGGSHNWLVPAMLAPPESLLISCIRRENFMEAHQVCGQTENRRCRTFRFLLLNRRFCRSAGVGGSGSRRDGLQRRAGLHGALQRSAGGVGTGGAEDGEPVHVVLVVFVGGFGLGGWERRWAEPAGEQRPVHAAGHRERRRCRYDGPASLHPRFNPQSVIRLLLSVKI